MNRMLAPLFAALAAGAMLASPATAVNVDQVPQDITIKDVVMNGSGCAKGTADVQISDDKQAVTAKFNDYMASYGPASGPNDFRKACQISMNLIVPNGYTYALTEADFYGGAYIAQGATGTLNTSWYYQGDSSTMQGSKELKYPHSGPFDYHQSKAITNDIWAPCNVKRLLNIKTELRINKGSQNNFDKTTMWMDKIDSTVSTKIHVKYKKC